MAAAIGQELRKSIVEKMKRDNELVTSLPTTELVTSLPITEDQNEEVGAMEKEE